MFAVLVNVHHRVYNMNILALCTISTVEKKKKNKTNKTMNISCTYIAYRHSIGTYTLQIEGLDELNDIGTRLCRSNSRVPVFSNRPRRKFDQTVGLYRA